MSDDKFRIRKFNSFGCADQFVTKNGNKGKTLATVDSKISALSLYSNQRDGQQKSAAENENRMSRQFSTPKTKTQRYKSHLIKKPTRSKTTG